LEEKMAGNSQGRKNSQTREKKEKGIKKAVPPSANVKEICPDCNIACEPNTDSVCCDICEYWFHAMDCQGLKESLFLALCEDDESDLHWYCRGCKRAAAKVVKSVSAMSERQDKMEENLRTVSGRLEKIEEGEFTDAMRNMIQSEVKKAVDSCVGEVKKDIETSSSGAHRGKVIDRSRNLIFFREPECDEQDNTPEVDKAKIESILSGKLKLTDITVKSVTRLGKRDKDTKRPILVSLEKEEDRTAVLTKLDDIRKTDKDLIKTLFISRDLSVSQREARKALRSEYNRRKEAGESVMIKRGKVVPRTETGTQSG